MCHVIPKGTTNNDQRTIDFFVGTTADPLAPKTSGVAGVAPRLRFGDNALETGDNTIAAISAADGWYRYTLSDAEANNDVCLASLFLDASDVADIAPVREPFQIGPSDVNTAASTPSAIADEVQTRTIAAVTTVNGLAANSVTASALATDAVNEIVAAVFARTFDATKMSGLTFEQIVGLMASALLAKASGLATTTATFRNPGDTANAIVATVDEDGNRSAVTLTASAVA